MNAENEEDFEDFKNQFLEDWRDNTRLINYFEAEWLPKKEKWCKAWRTVSFFFFFEII